MKYSTNLLDLPIEILLKIFNEKENVKNSSLAVVCKKFYQVFTKLNNDKIKLNLNSKYLLNLNFNFDEILRQSKSISINYIWYQSTTIENFDEKFLLFLKLHGSKVTSVNYFSFDEDLNIMKFIYLMPNLQQLILSKTSNHLDNNFKLSTPAPVQRNSISLKKLKIENYISDIKTLDTLAVFDVEELKVNDINHKINGKLKLKFVEFVQNLKNLRKYSGDCYIELLNVLAAKNIDSISLNLLNMKEFKILEFLKSKIDFKSLKIDGSEIIIESICNNFKNLEELDLTINIGGKILKLETFMKISTLKSLRKLKIHDCGYDFAFIENLCTIKLPNLESLSILSKHKLPLQLLFENFKQLKKLKINLHESNQNSEDISRIFKNFNQLESLHIINSLSDSLNLNEDFYSTNHSNSRLKTLELHVEQSNLPSLLQKIKNDFQNLENIILGSNSKTEYCEELSKQVLLHFNDPSKKLFYIHPKSAANGNELLKDFSCDFKTNFRKCFCCIIKGVKDGNKHTSFNIEEYFNYCKLQVMLHTSRKLKYIEIDLKLEENQTINNNFTDYLKSIGQHVIKLKINLESIHDNSQYTPHQLKQILEAFPNLQSIELSNICFESFKDQIIEIKNEKIEEIVLKHIDQKGKIMCYSFFNCIRFIDDTLKHVQVILSVKESNEFDKKFLENQKQLTKYEEKITGEKHYD